MQAEVVELDYAMAFQAEHPKVLELASGLTDIALIDGHEFGYGTCIFTRDVEAARDFTDKVKVGMVGVNVPLPVPVANPQLWRLETLTVR